MLDKLLDKMEEIIGFEKSDFTNLADGISIKNVGILIICSIKDDGKCYPKIFLVA